jgi:ubiquinone/menaquinone biosynthesis C-methylase UbiE
MNRKNRVVCAHPPQYTARMSEQERSYVIGTHDAEIQRLGVQHRVWRASVLDLWNIAGITRGQTIIDAGAGSGYATRDLAEIVGPSGRVIALERSHRFLSALNANAEAHRFANVEAVDADLMEYEWPNAIADRIWCRWVLTFLADPARAVAGFARALKPGGKAIIQEYYDYASWHLAPRSDVFEAYVAKIIAHWRASGGEPDIGLELPRMLAAAGLEVETVRPVVFTARMNDFAARWPNGFARGYLPVMREAGAVTAAEATKITAVLDRYEADPNALVITPGVLQVIARKP